MSLPSLVELATCGAHYGNHRSFIYPKARGALFSIKNNIALINLEVTQERIIQAARLFQEIASQGGKILFVGTKKINRQVVSDIAQKIGAPYINERWFGGFLTNFESFRSQIKVMRELEESLANSNSKLGKKELIFAQRRLARLKRFLGSVEQLDQLPDLIVLTSANEDKIALEEANRLNIPVIAITDMRVNPERVSVAIPANDSAPKAVKLILESVIAEDTLKPTTKNNGKSSKSSKQDDGGSAKTQTSVQKKRAKTDGSKKLSANTAVKVKAKEK